MVAPIGYIGEKPVYANGGSFSTQPPVNTSLAPQSWSPAPQNYADNWNRAEER